MEEYIQGSDLSNTLNAYRQPETKGFCSLGSWSSMV